MCVEPKWYYVLKNGWCSTENALPYQNGKVNLFIYTRMQTQITSPHLSECYCRRFSDFCLFPVNAKKFLLFQGYNRNAFDRYSSLYRVLNYFLFLWKVGSNAQCDSFGLSYYSNSIPDHPWRVASTPIPYTLWQMGGTVEMVNPRPVLDQRSHGHRWEWSPTRKGGDETLWMTRKSQSCCFCDP